MENRKRKKPCPKRLSNERQQELAWNLSDLCLREETSKSDIVEDELVFKSCSPSSTASIRRPNNKRIKRFDVKEKPVDLVINTSFPKSWHCVLGTFTLVMSDHKNGTKLTEQPCCHVKISLDKLLSNEYHGKEDDNILPDKLRDLSMEGRPLLSEELFDAIVFLQKKFVLFLVLSSETSIFDTSWKVMVCFYESALTNMVFASQDTRVRMTDKMVRVLMEYFFENTTITHTCTANDEQTVNDFNYLYKVVMDKKVSSEYSVNESDNKEDFQHPDLKPTLRGYQKRAVEWMISKEKHCKSQQNDQDLHVLWRRCITTDKKILFYNPYNGRLTTRYYHQPTQPLGGILADEMGLGKTVEVLACILNNPKINKCDSRDTKKTNVNALRESYDTSELTKPAEIFAHAEGNSGTTQDEEMIHTLPTRSVINDAQGLDVQLCNDIETQLSPPSIATNNKNQYATHDTEVIDSTQVKSVDSIEHNYIQTPSKIGVDHPLLKESNATLSKQISSGECRQQKSPYVTDMKYNTFEDGLQIKSSQLPSTYNIAEALQIPPIFDIKNAVCCDTKATLSTQMLSEDVTEETFKTPLISDTEYDIDGDTKVTSRTELLLEDSKQTTLTTDIKHAMYSASKAQGSSQSTTADSKEWDLKTTLTIENKHATSSTTNTSQPGIQLTTANVMDQTTKPVITCECVCGESEANEDVIQCSNCGINLHAKCFKGCKTGFLCPKCSVNRPPIESRATLIISPETIVHQWVQEITRHITQGAMKLMVYEGVNKQGFIIPEVLGDNDVILTTYTTLRTEFHHLKREDGRNMRYQKRYMALPSPLTAINFWRVCLDEAQMVETTTAKAAEMALQLNCVHRWCVTGTPIQKGLEDIYGLLLFLGAYPYCQRVWWKKLLCDPYLTGYKEPMQNVLSDLLWRTAKNDVLDEIHLPSQTEHLVNLTFSPVEQHFYLRQHEECSSWALRMLRQFGKSDVKLNSLDRHTVHKMLIPLLRLRQACCHPQAVRGGFLSMHKSTLTMEQLLENLISKAKLECEEAHRQLLFAINGLAGISVIKEEFAAAVDLYRESMQSWTEHEKFFRTDKLQKLHTLHNLNELISVGHHGCSHTLRDDKLKDEMDSHIKEYMEKPNTQVETALTSLQDAKLHTQQLQTKVEQTSSWWVIAIDNSQRRALDGELIIRIRDQLSFMENSSILDSFTDWRGLQYVLTAKIEKMMWTRSNLVQALDGLCIAPSPSLVQSTALCCLRTKPDEKLSNKSNRCRFCQVDNIFSEYESRLFGHQGMKGITGQEIESTATELYHHGNTGGLRAETDTEKALKTLFVFIKHFGLVPELHQNAQDHLAFIETLRKEFKVLRGAWFALRERVSSMDELDMCTTRLRLAHPCETISELDTNVIQPSQVGHQKLKFSSDRIVAQTELRKRLGQFMYLTNLSKKSNQGENPDSCPVCTKQLGKQWSVFTCGHCYCCQCVCVLVRHANTKCVKCPVCRAPTMTAEISYVSSSNSQQSGYNSVTVKGSHSTKVEAIVRTLLTIAAEDSTAKCLVFSTWQDVLELIGRALEENNVPFRHITCVKKLQSNLDTFKNEANINVMLLPLQTGSNGLNIIEATHVLLVEPALNPAHELQAIGRVHRIGQTRPTHVHRFVIENTVESRMYSLIKSTGIARTGCKDTDNPSLTIADLATLFHHDDSPIGLP